jgi:hypothetical protein
VVSSLVSGVVAKNNIEILLPGITSGRRARNQSLYCVITDLSFQERGNIASEGRE